MQGIPAVRRGAILTVKYPGALDSTPSLAFRYATPNFSTEFGTEKKPRTRRGFKYHVAGHLPFRGPHQAIKQPYPIVTAGDTVCVDRHGDLRAGMAQVP